MNDEQEREITAKLAAQRLLIGGLLRMVFLTMPREDRATMAKAIRKAASRTEQFFGATKGDDFAAERLADIVTRIQAHVDRMLEEALESSQQAESDMS